MLGHTRYCQSLTTFARQPWTVKGAEADHAKFMNKHPELATRLHKRMGQFDKQQVVQVKTTNLAPTRRPLLWYTASPLVVVPPDEHDREEVLQGDGSQRRRPCGERPPLKLCAVRPVSMRGTVAVADRPRLISLV